MCSICIGFKVIFVKKVPQIGAGSVKLSFTEMFPWNLQLVRNPLTGEAVSRKVLTHYKLGIPDER